MRVLIVGGGIGGRATAIALEQAGLEPYVLEQSSELTEIGSGIGMHANAMRVLTHLGADGFVRQSGVRIDTGEWRRSDDNSMIFVQQFGAMAERYGDVYICMHRADLHQAISANPFITFFTVATESGTLEFRWTGDNGLEATATAKIVVE